ncbi:hypothetical protein ES288_D09G090400v1 [Gossypium darwinii]|uniref:BED-type domain-containing protein n=1 Tax=Gossypium darwinii TaxID=34276 RepID=A0A5D2B799_GOSDA|nr:hypothetical protein ES288_D09G090400v1 [Gossypium darwinii]
MASSNTPIPVDDGFNEYESALKRQKSTTLKVWDEMTKLECENKNKLKAQCNHCKTIFSAKSSSGTSHLRRHLNSCIQPSPKGVPSIKNYKFDADECRQAISTFIVYMMRIASPNFKNISRHIAARDGLMYYAKERDHVKEELAKAPGLICLTSDNWNSEHTNDEYICVTAHWVDKYWKLQKRIIRFRALFPPYDGLNIADELDLCLSQWGIDKKIFSITLGNASYNDVMVSCLKNRFRANRPILCYGAFFQVRCCAHILNLIVKAGLELADDVVGKIRNGIRYIKKSGICRKRFYDVADKSFHLNVTKKLRQDCRGWKVHKVFLDTVKGPYSFLTPMLNYVQYCFKKIYGIHASDFVETILSNLRLLFDEYVKKSKSMFSSLAGSSNCDDYKQYLDEFSTRSEKSHLDIYLEEQELELNSQIDVSDYWSKSSVRYNELSLLARDLLVIPISTVASESALSMGKKVITPLRSSLKPKTVQAVVCLDDWMRAKGFSAEIGCKKDDEDDVSSVAF